MDWLKILFGLPLLVWGMLWFYQLRSPKEKARFNAGWFLTKENYIRDISSSTGLMVLGAGLLLAGLFER